MITIFLSILKRYRRPVSLLTFMLRQLITSRRMSRRLMTMMMAFAESFRKDYEKMLEEKRIPEVSSKDETLASSSNSDSDSDSVSDSDSDYDESMEQLHDELTRKEMARLKALEANAGGTTSKITPPIKIFNNLNLLDDDLLSDVPVDSNHPINTQSEKITVQV
ncbi:hypothetical protein C1645_788102 [Glomus cerebriforme]|uniref:Uncharacterized protein n=1 Tax=Glomus cerebriforme TaxID=658196 RepID=A0A397S8D1_9GLOM|nr:hypothetical protein C1645_788102 [Glomus cerebriforme]